MMDLTATSELAVAWQWARTEVSSPRFRRHYEGSLTPSIVAAVARGDAAALSSMEWTQLHHVVFCLVRNALLSGLRRLGTTWYVGRVSPEDLADLRLMNWPPFRAVSPSLQLTELVQALDRGDEVPDEPTFASNYRSLRGALDVAQLTAAPILIAMNAAGPYGIVEGNSRFAVLLSRHMQGTALPEVPVVVGVCARIEEWRLRDQQDHRALYWGGRRRDPCE